MDTLENAFVARDITEAEVIRQALRRQTPGEFRVGHECLQFRRKYQAAAMLGPIQRLFAGTIARQEQNSASLIINSEGKHSTQPRDASFTPCVIGRQQDFRVAATGEMHAAGC